MRRWRHACHINHVKCAFFLYSNHCQWVDLKDVSDTQLETALSSFSPSFLTRRLFKLQDETTIATQEQNICGRSLCPCFKSYRLPLHAAIQNTGCVDLLIFSIDSHLIFEAIYWVDVNKCARILRIVRRDNEGILKSLIQLNRVGNCKIGPNICLIELVCRVTIVEHHVVLGGLDSSSCQTFYIFDLFIEKLGLRRLELFDLFEKICDNTSVLMKLVLNAGQLICEGGQRGIYVCVFQFLFGFFKDFFFIFREQRCA